MKEHQLRYKKLAKFLNDNEFTVVTSNLRGHGENDPCVLGEKGISSSIKTLKNASYTTISKIKYPNMRHEIINERNNDIVYKDILNFINSNAEDILNENVFLSYRFVF